MILTCHLLVGAVITSKIKFLPLAFLFAFLSHYFLDFIPHWEYSFENIKERRWKNSFSDFLKVALDTSLGVLLIFIFSKNWPVAVVGGFFAILADGPMFINLIFPNKLLKIFEDFHQKIHYPKGKKISFFWRIFSQLVIALIAIFFLR